MTWLPVTLTWLPLTLTWLLYNLQAWRHKRWFPKLTVRFWPIRKERATSMYNNNYYYAMECPTSHLYFLHLHTGQKASVYTKKYKWFMEYSMVYHMKALHSLLQYVLDKTYFVKDKILSFWLLQPCPIISSQILYRKFVHLYNFHL